MTTVSELKPPRTFVMPATPDADGNLLFPWVWASWREEPRLVVESTTPAQSGQGSASFRVVRSQQTSERLNGEANASTNLRAGCYVLVTQSVTTTGSGESTVVVPVADGTGWLGIITEISEAPVGSYGPGTTARIPDGIGSATASELGASLFDQVRADGWAQIGGSGSPLPMITTPPANIQTKGGKIVGNAFLGTKDGNPAYLFARELDQLGTDEEQVWTRWRLLTHLVQFCLPPSLPPVVIAAEDGSGISGAAYVFINKTGLAAWMDRPDALEVFELSGLTIRGVLDLLCGAGVGLGWRLELVNVSGVPSVKIVVYSRGDWATEGGPPKLGDPSGIANSRTLNTYGSAGERLATVEVTSDGAEQYDEVIVRGAPIVFAATLGALDDNMEAAWSAAQETAYAAATPEERKRPEFSAVYSSFRLKRTDPQYGATRRALPGESGSYLPITPEVTWNGTAATITTDNVDQYRPTFRFLSALPWPAGWDGTGTPTTDASGSPGEAQTTPRAFAFQDSQWIPLTAKSGSVTAATLSESPEFDVSETAPALSLSYDVAHTIGLNDFDPDVSESGGVEPVYDWRNLLFSVAYQSTQRLEVVIRREHNGSPLTANQVRRSLILEDDTLQYVVALGGTIIGTGSENLAAYRVDADTVIRNDYPAAQRWAEEAASWAFRPRDQVTATMAIATGSDLRVGMAIKRVQTDTQVRDTDAIIASLSYDWTAGRLTVQTEVPPAPQRRGKGGGSSPQGGNVSVELGGTVGGVTQRHAAAIADLQAAVAAIPVIPAQHLGEPPALIVRVTAGLAIGDVIHWTGTVWELADVADKADTLALVVAEDTVGPIAAAWGLTYLDPAELLLTDHTDYYLVDGGTLTATKPAANAVLVLRHYIDGIVVVRSGGGGVSVLDDLDDVNAPTPTGGQLLSYDSGTSKWVPVSPTSSALTVTGPAVIGKTGSGSGAASDITATTANRVLSFAAGVIAWTQIATDMVADLAITAAKIATGTITNTQINASAAIAWTKISKTGSSLADLTTRSAADLTSGTLPDARMPAMTGDATSTAGTVALTLASVITAGGPTGSASVVPVITYDAKGRLTAVTTATITPSAIGAVPTSRTIAAGTGLTGGGDLSADRTLTVAYGTSGTTACVGNDARLSDARTPLAHGHTIAGDVTGTTAASVVEKWRGASVAAAVGSVSGSSRADLVTWWDKTNLVWTTFSLNSVSAVTGWINCYDTAATDANGKMTGVMAGTACSLFGRSANTDGLPAGIAAAADGTILGRASSALSFLYDVTLGNGTNNGKMTVRRSASASRAIVLDPANDRILLSDTVSSNEAILTSASSGSLRLGGTSSTYALYSYDAANLYQTGGVSGVLTATTLTLTGASGANGINSAGLFLRSGGTVKVNGTQVLAGQLSAVADVAGTAAGTDAAVINEIKARLNELLNRVRASTGHGLIS